MICRRRRRDAVAGLPHEQRLVARVLVEQAGLNSVVPARKPDDHDRGLDALRTSGCDAIQSNTRSRFDNEPTSIPGIAPGRGR